MKKDGASQLDAHKDRHHKKDGAQKYDRYGRKKKIQKSFAEFPVKHCFLISLLPGCRIAAAFFQNTTATAAVRKMRPASFASL